MAEKKTDHSKMRAVRYAAFNKEEEQITWLVDGILPDVGWTFFIGREGSGKSTFALQLCGALQTGTPFLNRETIQTDTLYIQADSPSVEWREMTRSIVPEDQGVTVVNVPAKCLGNKEYVKYLDELINVNVKPGFVVWDSLYNLTAIDINTERGLETIQLMKLLSGTRPWLLVHHPPQEELRAAGHHSLSANCSRVWLLTKSELKIPKGRLSKIKSVKMYRDETTELGLWVATEETGSRDKAAIQQYPFLGNTVRGD